MKYSSMKLKIVNTNLQSVLLFATILAVLFLNGCGGKAETKSKTAESDVRPAETVRVRENVATFLGNPSRSFYGTGPWGTQPLEVLWSVKTGAMAGPNHKIAWGGSAWPGQPSTNGERVYFGSADGNVYAINAKYGNILWKFQGQDSMKATPVIVGDKILANGLDTYVYCLNASDGKLLWKFKAIG